MIFGADMASAYLRHRIPRGWLRPARRLARERGEENLVEAITLVIEQGTETMDETLTIKRLVRPRRYERRVP